MPNHNAVASLSILAIPALMGCTPETVEGAFEGPDGATTVETEQDEVLVAMTHLRVRNLPGPGGKFGDHANRIGNYLYEETPDGWLGAAFRNVGQLDWWTVTVWESEEAMMDFVVSEPHVSAMADLGVVAAAAESRHEWMAPEEAPPAWAEIVELLEVDARFVYVR